MCVYVPCFLYKQKNSFLLIPCCYHTLLIVLFDHYTFFPLLFLALGSFLRILNAAPPFLLSLSPPLSAPETSSFNVWSFLLITLFFSRASTLCRKDWTKHPDPTRFFLCARSGLPALWLLPAVLHHHLSHVLPKSERAKLARHSLNFECPCIQAAVLKCSTFVSEVLRAL